MFSAVSVTWNGTTITGPVLIYSDEIPVDGSSNNTIDDPNGPGALICRSEDRARVSWHYVSGIIVRGPEFTADMVFLQFFLPFLQTLITNSGV